MRLGVFGRFLVITASTCLLVFFLGVLLFQWNSYRVAQDTLQAKLDSLAGVYALILAEPLALERYDQVELYSVGLLVDKEVAGFSIADLQGNVIQKFGDFDPEAFFSKTTIIRFADESGAREVGQIDLVMSTAIISKRAYKMVVLMVLMLGGLLLVALACSALAYWRAVGIPLRRLTSEIRRFQEEGVHRDVEIHTDDQLGEVIQEYNRMQDIAAKQREQLLHQQQGLEVEVSIRTEELEQEVEQHQSTSKRLSYFSEYDPLTGLPNRLVFQERVSMWMLDLNKTNEYGALCFIDIDDFKTFNMTAGYMAGDRFLSSASKLIELSINDDQGFLARLSSDEFVLLFKGKNTIEATQCCQKIIDAAHEYEFGWGGEHFKLSLSIGIKEIDQNSVSYDDVLMKASQACEAAKSKGGNCSQVYQDSEQNKAEAKTSQKLEQLF